MILKQSLKVPKMFYCERCDFKSNDRLEQNQHISIRPWHTLSNDISFWNKDPDTSNTVSDEEIVKRLKGTIEFLKVESIGGIWNTPQLIEMLEDHFKVERRSR